jgi:uncharacterized OB-fold protein
MAVYKDRRDYLTALPRDMVDITDCVVCGKTLKPERVHVDTCGARCFKVQLAEQREEGSTNVD